MSSYKFILQKMVQIDLFRQRNIIITYNLLLSAENLCSKNMISGSSYISTQFKTNDNLVFLQVISSGLKNKTTVVETEVTLFLHNRITSNLWIARVRIARVV